MSKPKYDPKGNYYAKVRIRRTASCVNGLPAKTPGTVYVEPSELDENGRPVTPYQTFTMADRSPEEIELLVSKGVIVPVPAS